MKNKVWIALAIILVLAISGYLTWRFLLKKTPEEKAAEALEEALKSAATGGVLPEMSGTTNPLEGANLPDTNPKIPATNPLDKTNPFKDVYQNPFE